MGLSIWQIAIIAVVVLVLFGRGRISEMMGDFGKGIKSFKQGLNEDDDIAAAPPPRIEGPVHTAKPVDATVEAPATTERRDPPR